MKKIYLVFEDWHNGQPEVTSAHKTKVGARKKFAKRLEEAVGRKWLDDNLDSNGNDFFGCVHDMSYCNESDSDFMRIDEMELSA